MRNRIPRGTIRALTNLPKAPAGTPAAIAEAPAPAGTPAAIAEAPAPAGTPAAIVENVNPSVTEIQPIQNKNRLNKTKNLASATNAFKKSVKPPALPPHLRGESIATSKTLEEVHNESLKRNTSDVIPPVQAQPPISAPKPESKPAPPVNYSEMSKPSVEKAPRRLPSLANRRVSVASNTTQATTSSKKSNESHSDRPGWNQRFVSTADFANWARPMQISYLRGLKKQNLDTSKFEPFMKKSKGGRRKRRMKTGRRI